MRPECRQRHRFRFGRLPNFSGVRPQSERQRLRLYHHPNPSGMRPRCGRHCHFRGFRVGRCLGFGGVGLWGGGHRRFRRGSHGDSRGFRPRARAWAMAARAEWTSSFARMRCRWVRAVWGDMNKCFAISARPMPAARQRRTWVSRGVRSCVAWGGGGAGVWGGVVGGILAAACRRVVTPSLVRVRWTWQRTVARVMPSSRAISLVDRPSLIRRSTWCSRGVRGSASAFASAASVAVLISPS